jgi:hypothetical protein
MVQPGLAHRVSQRIEQVNGATRVSHGNEAIVLTIANAVDTLGVLYFPCFFLKRLGLDVINFNKAI